MGKDKTNKPLLKKILLIVWIVACTAVFVYFSITLIKYTNIAIEQLADFKVPNAAEIYPDMDVQSYIQSQQRGITQNIFLITAFFVLYGSFMAFAIPNAVSLFRKSLIKNGIDKPTL